MEAGGHSINVLGFGSTSIEEIMFEDLYNEEVKIQYDKGGGYRSNYPEKEEIKFCVEMKD